MEVATALRALPASYFAWVRDGKPKHASYVTRDDGVPRRVQTLGEMRAHLEHLQRAWRLRDHGVPRRVQTIPEMRAHLERLQREWGARPGDVSVFRARLELRVEEPETPPTRSADMARARSIAALREQLARRQYPPAVRARLAQLQRVAASKEGTWGVGRGKT